jgi:uncharacterized protein (TIGR02147 family)
MVSPFEFDNYRKFLTKRLKEMPKKGYGQMSRLAVYLGVHSTLVSQVLKQHKSFSTDQAALVAEFFGLNELESEYFILLVQIERAGNTAAKNHYTKQLQRVLEHANTISHRVRVDAELSEEQRAVFYSDWAYSAIRQSVAIHGLNHAEPIAEYLGLPRKKVQKFLEFLVKAGLCNMKKGEFKVGPASTHVEASSPWVRVHHTNWRQKAIQSLDGDQSDKLYYTSPLTLAKRDCDVIREKILQFIEQVNSIVDPSPSETFYCLNVDWFPVEKKKA